MGTGRKKGPGGGGAALNFKVVGNPQPANPKENTIWLNTDVDITGHSFAAEQPEMQPGEVWISTGMASQVAFNALKKGGTVMVYPISAKQMQGGTLVDVTAKSWQDGEWVEWITDVYLYNHGDSCTDIGGDWVVYYSNGTFALNADHIEIKSTNQNSGLVSIGKADMLAVDDMDIITLTAEIVSSTTGSIYVGINSSKASSLAIINASPAVTTISTKDKIGSIVDISVDVSFMDGQYYVFVAGLGAFTYKMLSVKYTRRENK